ncbi:MAG: cytochrome c peroxidase [Anaeromyxobacteraceae bacterium]
MLTFLVSCGGEPPAQKLGSTRQALVSSLQCKAPGTGFGDVIAPPPAGTLPFMPLAPLKTAPNPVLPPHPVTGAPTLRGDLAGFYIADVTAAIQLGKALFWDVQAGSDNRTACATCHFQAGGDVRSRNQLNPGFNARFDGASTNYQLGALDFPFVNGPATALTRNIDNVAGSAGVRPLKFAGMTTAGLEQTTPTTDPIFGTMRQVTGMNAPTVVNAVYNHRNFGNGRAQPEFNGVNPWGKRDANARAWLVNSTGAVVQFQVVIPDASLASQAVGPPLSSVEMSSAGRTFPDIGVKLLARTLKPLGLQRVDPTDSVLGGLAATGTGAKGLNTTYAALIQKAFYPMWWNSAALAKSGSKNYTLMQANFSLYWGLAIMLYEATLISDASPMDSYVATRFDPITKLPLLDPATGQIIGGDATLLQPVVDRLAAQGVAIPLAAGGTRPVAVADVVRGLELFEKPVPPPGTIGLPPGFGAGCAFCHVGAETTSASTRNLTVGIEVGAEALKGAGFDLRMERMFMGLRTPAPAPLPGFWPTPPQPPPLVPVGTDAITYDDARYQVTVTSINNTAVTPQVVPVNTYDVGWYNVGVRPTTENVGLGGLDLAKRPLSWTEYFQTTLLNPASVLVPGGGLGCVDVNGNPAGVPLSAPLGSPFAGQVLDPATGFPLLSGGLSKTEATDVAGSFKTPMLRNVELTGPYFHTGGKATLRQAVELYDDGGNFANASLAPFIRPLGLSEDQVAGLVAFLVALTDDRVLLEKPPFDHPELPLPVGQDAAGADVVQVVPAVGAAGSAVPVPRFLGLNPFAP